MNTFPVILHSSILASLVSLHLSVLIMISLAAETCYEGPGGASPTEARAGGHNIQVTKAMISKPAPDFSGTAVVNGEFTEIKLSDYRGKYLVFFFYPLDFTFVCPTEILAFNDRVKEFRQIGVEVGLNYFPSATLINLFNVNVRLWPALSTLTSLIWPG